MPEGSRLRAGGSTGFQLAHARQERAAASVLLRGGFNDSQAPGHRQPAL